LFRGTATTALSAATSTAANNYVALLLLTWRHFLLVFQQRTPWQTLQSQHQICTLSRSQKHHLVFTAAITAFPTAATVVATASAATSL
jgi:hypothetical protein